MGERRGEYRVSVRGGGPGGKRPLGRPRCRGKYLKELGWGGLDWIDLAQDREGWRALVNAVLKLRVP